MDATEIKLFNDENRLAKFPKECQRIFGTPIHDCKNINWLILDTLIKDVINESYGKDKISFSDPISECVTKLKKFNNDNVYHNPKLHTKIIR